LLLEGIKDCNGTAWIKTSRVQQVVGEGLFFRVTLWKICEEALY